MPNVLVTGGNGFLGRNIIPELLNNRWKVTNLSLHPILNMDVENIIFDAFADDPAPLLKDRDFDAVIHLAAFASPRLASDYSQTIKLNVELTEKLLNISKSFKSIKKFLFFSSATTYSDEAARPLKENAEQKAHEGDNYAFSKIEAEKVCKKYAAEGLPVKILRLTNCFGPWQNWESKPNLIPQIMKEAILEGKITIMNGKYTRDFLYSKDLARIISVLLVNTENFDILNIATGEEHSVEEAAEFVSKRLNVPIYDNKIEIDRAKNLILDISMFKKILTEFKFTNFEKALEETLNHYISVIIK